MDKLLNSALSAKLQELYLENKQWLTEILFLDEEMRFFISLFDQVIPNDLKCENPEQMEMINSNLYLILEARKQLKSILKLRQHQLAQLFNGNLLATEIEMIGADVAIRIEIRSLIAGQRLLKENLFMPPEKQKLNHLPVASRPLTVHSITA